MQKNEPSKRSKVNNRRVVCDFGLMAKSHTTNERAKLGQVVVMAYTEELTCCASIYVCAIGTCLSKEPA